MLGFYFRLSVVTVCLCASSDTIADDAVLKLSNLLKLSSESSQRFQGTITTYQSENPGKLTLKFDKNLARKEFTANCWVKGKRDLLFEVEVPKVNWMATVGPGSRFNETTEVIAKSKKSYFQYVPIGSMAMPYANLSIFDIHQGSNIDDRLDADLWANLNAFHEIAGFPVLGVLANPSYHVKFDLSQGAYEVTGSQRGPEVNSELLYSLRLADGSAECHVRFSSRVAPADEVVFESLVQGTFTDISLTPSLIIRRVSSPQLASPQVSIVELTNELKDQIAFPIDKQFFVRYQREYAVLIGESTTSSELIDGVPNQFRTEAQRFGSNMSGSVRKRSNWLLVTSVSLVVLFLTFVSCRLFFRRKST